MRTTNGAVQRMPLVVYIRLKRGKKPVPLALLRPAIEPIEYGFPRAEFNWQVTPRDPRPPPPKHCLNEVAIVQWRPAGPSLGRQYRRNLRPLAIVERQPDTHAAPLPQPWCVGQLLCNSRI